MESFESGKTLPRVRTACGLGAVAIGLLTFGGWLTGVRRLAEVRTGYIPMAPNTACGMVLFGAALAALPGADVAGARAGRRRRLALAVAAPAALLALARLSEYATGRVVGVDRLLMSVPSERLGLAPVGRMALFTALEFASAGVALGLAALSRRWPRAADLAGFLALGVACLGGAFLLGYVYDSPFLYGGRMIPMAMNTAAGFVLLGTGLVAATGSGGLLLRPVCGDTVGARLLRTFPPFVVATVMLTSWATHWVAVAAGGRLAALVAGGMTVSALLLGALLCARLALRVGLRIEEAEDALRRANDALEARVADRTAELSQAKAQLEDRNRALEQTAQALTRTAESVRTAHSDLQDAYRELQLAECQLVQAEKLSALGQMVAGVAHEINNPLAFVSNNVAVLQRDVTHVSELLRLYQQAEGALGAHQRELMARIHDLAERFDLAYVLDNLEPIMARSREGLRRIEQIVKDLRDFVRLDEGERKRADVNDGIRSTFNVIRSFARTREVNVELELAELPELLCHPAKLNQVVLNLLTNAIDASPPGGRVTVSTRETRTGVEITVADQGPGIDPDLQPRIFDPFFTTKPAGQGTGLGLAISLGIVRSHGGTLECESAPGCGTRFIVRLPFAPPPRSEGDGSTLHLLKSNTEA